MTLPAYLTPSAPALSRRHRSWIALYILDSSHSDRLEVLRQNNVTETDLQEFFESWFQLRGLMAGVMA